MKAIRSAAREGPQAAARFPRYRARVSGRLWFTAIDGCSDSLAGFALRRSTDWLPPRSRSRCRCSRALGSPDPNCVLANRPLAGGSSGFARVVTQSHSGIALLETSGGSDCRSRRAWHAAQKLSEGSEVGETLGAEADGLGVVTQRVIGGEATRENADVGQSHSTVLGAIGIAEVSTGVCVGVILHRVRVPRDSRVPSSRKTTRRAAGSCSPTGRR